MSPDSPPDLPGHLSDEALRLYADAGCGHVVLDADGGIVRINDPLRAWLGDAGTQPSGRPPFRARIVAADQPRFDAAWAALDEAGPRTPVELELRGAGGRPRLVQFGASVLRDAAGMRVGAQALLIDLDHRRQAERQAQRGVRALRVLGAMNAELLHADQEPAFLEAVCRAIVERGGYRLAAVGYAEHDPGRRVRVVARASADAGHGAGYLDGVEISWADNARGQGPTGRAIRSGLPQVNRDFLTDPAMQPWREAARAFGYQSSIALPLKAGRTPLGALSIYAPEPDAFDEDEIRLLGELADDLSFGIDTLRARVEHRRTEAMIARLAYHDPLTGLGNRTRLLALIRDRLPQASAAAPLLLMTVTIQRFDDMLAGLGVRPADQLLAQASDRLLQAIGGHGAEAARIGGKSFAILLPGGDGGRAVALAGAIRTAMRPPFPLAGIPLAIDVAIGAALAPDHAEDADTLLVRATIAGRDSPADADGGCAFYRGSALEDRRWLTVLGELRTAIDRQQLQIVYQPKLRTGDSAITGAEALLRWAHPQRGLVSPAEFMPIAEQSGLIGPLTDHVVELVLRQQRAWVDDGFRLPVAVNVSARNLADAGFADRLLVALARHRIDPALLQLELTEGALVHEPAGTRQQLLQLQRHGVGTAIDDFGTGYSSLAYLSELPVRALKIDRSFVVGMLGSERVRGIVAATISMAEALSLDSIAEGVEDADQAGLLVALGCRELQGYGIARPMPAADLRDWLTRFDPQSLGLPPRCGARP